MTESDRELIRHLTESVKELQVSVMQVHTLAAETKMEMRVELGKVSLRQEQFIQAHASFVKAIGERGDEHSERIDRTALEAAAGIKKTETIVNDWQSQARLVWRVALYVGAPGLIAVLALAAKALAK